MMRVPGTSKAVDLRDVARGCLDAALDAVEPGELVRKALSRGNAREDRAGRTFVMAIGKAAERMATGALESLPGGVAGGLVVTPTPVDADALAPLQMLAAEHPVPGPGSLEAGRALHGLAKSLEAGDRLLALISGGSSALVTYPPPGVSLGDVSVTTVLLLRAGTPIGELNCVRKHLDRLKGGRLAALCHPARTHALVVSDVVGDRLDVIASGLMTADSTSYDDALSVLRNRGVWDDVPAPVRDHLEAGARGEVPEAPGPLHPHLDRTTVEVIGNNELAAAAAAREAEARGFVSAVRSTTVEGEAREVGVRLSRLARRLRDGEDDLRPPACLVMGGETTVTVRGAGMGGPNLEVALGAAAGLAGMPDMLVMSVGTDGRDGPTDAAGAWVDGSTVERARKAGLDPAHSLTENDAYTFFGALDDLIVTGPTGTNVMDLMLVLVGGLTP
jgi:hydroxypyruvate reductase